MQKNVLDKNTLKILNRVANILQQGFGQMPEFTPSGDGDKIEAVLETVACRMQNNYPYHHPFYIGQMLKPPHPVAQLAYMLAMTLNPNNHALDGGRESSIMEKQVVSAIAGMFEWETHLGHLTSGGTMANLEALWIAGQIHPDKKILASSQAHYTHHRISSVLQLKFEALASDPQGKMCLKDLKQKLTKGDVGTVVVTLGTTGMGALDPLPEIIELQTRYHFRIHVDTAYGGYYTLVDNLHKSGKAIYESLNQVDSIVVDPHKHGLQPYGCGCILFKDPAVGSYYQHHSPYTYFSSDDLHLGEISLECSRSGASAVALWATQQLLPMSKNGEFAKGLARCRKAALTFYQKLLGSELFRPLIEPELDIVIWIPEAQTATEISNRSRMIFERGAVDNLHMALINLPQSLLQSHWPHIHFNTDTVTCLRACFMKPEHLQWLDRIFMKLENLGQDWVQEKAGTLSGGNG